MFMNEWNIEWNTLSHTLSHTQYKDMYMLTNEKKEDLIDRWKCFEYYIYRFR